MVQANRNQASVEGTISPRHGENQQQVRKLKRRNTAMKTQEAIKRYRAAKKMAHDILNDDSSALPDAQTVNQLAVAIFQADLASGGELFQGPARGFEGEN